MKCSEVIALLDPLIDGELTGQDQTNLTAHINQCTSCKSELADMRRLQNDLKAATIFSAPDSLRVNILREIKEERIHEGSLESPSFWSMHWTSFKTLFNSVTAPAVTHLGAALLGAFIIFLTMNLSLETSSPDTLRAELFDAHMNSLIDNNLIAVTSSDQHTVKPWFAGKVKYSPHVPDLKGSGFVLLGGRVDQLHNKTIAVLIYLRDKHKINVFISPITSNKEIENRQWSHNGYHVVSWHDETFTYSAISDLSAQGLALFAKAMATAIKK